MYNNTIEEVTECVHVGVTLNAYQNNTQLVKQSVSKVRGALMAINGSGADGMSCSSAVKLYKTVVLPRALYGAELWSDLGTGELNTIEKAHRFCLKYIQHLPKCTKTIIVQSMVNVYSMETYIDIRKLQFFGRLCTLYQAC